MLLHATDAPPPAGEASARVPVVLIHGLFGRARNLGRLLRLFGAERRTIGLDLRSHGDSPHGPLRIRDMADDVLETLDRHRVEHAVLIGHSLGGKVAMAATLLAPERVARLLVADIAPVAYAHGSRLFAEAMASLPIARFLTRAEADGALAETVPDATIRALLLQNLDARPPMRWRIGLRDIVASIGEAEGWPEFPPGTAYDGVALFLRGERSDYVAPEHHGDIRRFFPRARLATLREAGHWLHVDKPDEFAGIAASFVAAADAATARTQAAGREPPA